MVKQIRRVTSVICFCVVGVAVLFPFLLLQLCGCAGDWINAEMQEWADSL